MDPQAQFCPNMNCPARGQRGQGNVVIHSRQKARYQCTQCKQTFSATTGTPFYRLHHPLDQVVLVITLLAYGCPLQAIVAAFGLDERTVLDWQRRAGNQARQMHEHLIQQPRDLEHVQADELRVKGQGQVLWLAMALMVRTRLWLGGVVALQRDEALLLSLMHQVRACALARPLLICVDGFRAYLAAIQLAFRSPLPSGHRGPPRLIAWPQILIGQVVKHQQGKRLVEVTRRMAQGNLAEAEQLLKRGRGGSQINTAFIERLNATFRARLAVLVRRSRVLIQQPQTLEALMYLLGSVYNFCTPHKSLRLAGLIGGHKWIARSPALAAGLTDHIWTVKELLWYRVPPPHWQGPNHRGPLSKAEKALVARWCQ